MKKLPRLDEVFRIREAEFPWHKFSMPSKDGKSVGGNPDTMGTKHRDVSRIGPQPYSPVSADMGDDDEGESLDYDEMKRKYPKAAHAWDQLVDTFHDGDDTSGADFERDDGSDYYFLPNPNGTIYAYPNQDGPDVEAAFHYDPAHDEWGDT